jgi:hypothetical protein
MAQVDRAIGVGQGAGDEDFTWVHVLSFNISGRSGAWAIPRSKLFVRASRS